MTRHDAAPEQWELDAEDRAMEIAQRVGLTFSKAFKTYTELLSDGGTLTSKALAQAREQLLALTICLREIHDDHNIIEWLAANARRQHKDRDLRPTISAMRVMQRSYGLALSSDHSRRKLAIAPRDLAVLVAPLHNFWRDF